MTFIKLIVCLLWLAPCLLIAQEAKVTEVLSKDLSNLPGKEGLVMTVEYPPGASDLVHRHNAHGFIYVLEGSIVMQVRGGKEVTLTPGQTFYEGPDDVHVVGRNPRIQLHYSSELTALEGDEHLEAVTWVDKRTGECRREPIRHVFVMTGASPKTKWLSDCLSLDSKGFVLTGRDLESVTPPVPWPLSRAPYMLETSLPGVFVVGDARAGNVKRVASAVGEGSIVLHLVHQTLAEP